MAAIPFQVWTAATINHSPRVSLLSVPMGSKGKPKLAFTGRSNRPIFLTTPYAPFSVSRNRHQWLSYAQSSSGLGKGAEGPSGSENLILDEQSLEVELKNAIQAEDYARAARLRDDLRLLHENNQEGILAANARFYKAFEKGDLIAMGMIWSKGNNVHCIHPGAGCISGYDIVMESWELTFGPELDLPLQIELQNVEVYIKGNLGFITCLEVVRTSGNNWGKQVATNIFEKVDGNWYICVHHASHIAS